MFMEFGVLKVVSVISRSLHSRESHLKVLNITSFTVSINPAKNGIV